MSLVVDWKLARFDGTHALRPRMLSRVPAPPTSTGIHGRLRGLQAWPQDSAPYRRRTGREPQRGSPMKAFITAALFVLSFGSAAAAQSISLVDGSGAARWRASRGEQLTIIGKDLTCNPANKE